MSERPELLEVGRIIKAHGLRGELVVSLVTNMVEERTAPGNRFLAGDRWLTVIGTRPHQGKWLFTFEGVADRSEAEGLRSTVLLAEPLDSEDDVFVHELIGLRVVDQHGTDHGEVAAVVANPASDLMELADGRLIPLVFLVSSDDERAMVEVPPGLLDDASVDIAP